MRSCEQMADPVCVNVNTTDATTGVCVCLSPWISTMRMLDHVRCHCYTGTSLSNAPLYFYRIGIRTST